MNVKYVKYLFFIFTIFFEKLISYLRITYQSKVIFTHAIPLQSQWNFQDLLRCPRISNRV